MLLKTNRLVEVRMETERKIDNRVLYSEDRCVYLLMKKPTSLREQRLHNCQTRQRRKVKEARKTQS